LLVASYCYGGTIKLKRVAVHVVRIRALRNVCLKSEVSRPVGTPKHKLKENTEVSFEDFTPAQYAALLPDLLNSAVDSPLL
jgi:hypothetical protein